MTGGLNPVLQIQKKNTSSSSSSLSHTRHGPHGLEIPSCTPLWMFEMAAAVLSNAAADEG